MINNISYLKLDKLTDKHLNKLNQLCDMCAGYEPYYDTEDSTCFLYIGAFNITGDLVGFMGALQLEDTVEITGLVHPGYRRKGIFKHMISMIKDICGDISIICTIPSDWLTILKNSSLNPEYTYSELLMTLSKPLDLYEHTNGSFECLFSERYEYFLMYADDDEPVAVCNLDFQDSFTNIYSVFVDEDKRGQELGTTLMQALISNYFDEFDTPLVLHVNSNNVAAVKLYERCGFETVECVDYYTI